MGKVCHSHITYESQERNYLCSNLLRPYQKPGMDACPCNAAVGGWRQADLSSWLVGQPSQNDELLVLWETLSQGNKTESNRGRTWIHWCPPPLHAANTSVYHTHIQTHTRACTCTGETGHWVIETPQIISVIFLPLKQTSYFTHNINEHDSNNLVSSNKGA